MIVAVQFRVKPSISPTSPFGPRNISQKSSVALPFRIRHTGRSLCGFRNNSQVAPFANQTTGERIRIGSHHNRADGGDVNVFYDVVFRSCSDADPEVAADDLSFPSNSGSTQNYVRRVFQVINR